MSAQKYNECSFCGKSQDTVRRLIAGPNVNICDECINLCNTLMAEESSEAEVSHKELIVPDPHEIKEFLDGYVVGHAQTKKVLAVAVHNHYKRLKQKDHFSENDSLSSVEIEKSNIMLIGPTGSGKTLLARSLARMLDVPFAMVDATTLTEAGYVGEDVENILLSLIRKADSDVKRAETGIIYIDEIDKIGRRTENVSITRDVSGEGVQQALLKILEGTVARVPPGGGRKHPQQEYIKIDTRNILFICGGAFVGLGDIVKRRSGKETLGFATPEFADKRNKKQTIPEVETEDLIRYGLIPELIGRIPVVSTLEDLTESDLVHILVEPKNAVVKQYQKLLAMEDIDLSFTAGALKHLATMAIKRKTGARGLRSIIEKIMLDVMYEAPMLAKKQAIKITRSMIEEKMIDSESSSEKLKKAS